LRDNIDPLKRHNEESIIKVIADCCLSQLSESRKGLESEIEESGTNLSAGEKQLICIARAVLKRSPIVLIDEATANIDIDTEHQIQETIKS
jgi:ABC-type multidrug transport system fused ATPase/permease subunit